MNIRKKMRQQCDCGTIFINKASFNLHKRTACRLVKNKKRFKCDCGKDFSRKSSLNKHKETACILIMDKIRFQCGCGQTFTERGSRKKHKNTVCPLKQGSHTNINDAQKQTKKQQIEELFSANDSGSINMTIEESNVFDSLYYFDDLFENQVDIYSHSNYLSENQI